MGTRVFKVWSNSSILKKTAVVIKDNTDVLKNVINKSSQKLRVHGTSLCLESDGTPIDEDDILDAFAHETLLLLTEREVWKRCIHDSSTSFLRIEESTSKNQQVLISEENIISNPTDVSTELPAMNLSSSTSLSSSSLSSISTIVEEFENPPQSYHTQEHKKWENFAIPWDSLKVETKRILAQNTSVTDKKRKAILVESVDMVVAEMRLITKYPESKRLRDIALMMRNKFPSFFEDRWPDGRIMSNDGVDTLIMKLRNHNNYCNRPSQIQTITDELPQHPLPLKRQRLVKSIKAGTKNWDLIIQINLLETYEENRKLLLNHKSLDYNDAEQLELFTKALKNSYPAQRYFLNDLSNIPTAERILSDWPCLMDKYFIFLHFNMLTNKSIFDFETLFSSEYLEILKYGGLKKIVPLVLDTLTIDQKYWLTLEIIFKHFKEEPTVLFKLFKVILFNFL